MEEQQGFQYKVLEPAQDYKNAKIEKSGIKSTFTLREIETNRATFQKLEKELEAQILVQDATTTNIENFHPFVKEMSMEDMHTAGMFYQARGYRDECQKKLDVVKKLLADEQAEEETIMTILGFEKTETPAVEPTPEEPKSDVTPTPEAPQG